MGTTQPDATGVQAEALQRLLDGRYADLRRRIREVLSQPDFAPPIALRTAEYRDLVRGWMQTVADEGLTAPGFPEELGGQGDPGANIAGFEEIALGDAGDRRRRPGTRRDELVGFRVVGRGRPELLRGDAEALVDGFGIPDAVLRAPIAVRDRANAAAA